VPSAVLGVAAAGDVPEILQLIQQQDDVVGVHAERLGQLLLGRPVMVAQVAEGHHQPHVYSQQLLVAAAVDLLGQPRQQDHRAWIARPSLIAHNAQIIPRSNNHH
jgi:hypothetical protein